eukprot:Plantae.Rhodophyta-Purpureofilum_apyrenoidigerum.ctg26400.p1 GENE.Plantae.Rhodophyta-Purpureofilum_apyrenoidigerum.ctg26400~~Plantae.Rhodophyta-Purpureofilum_apyrenoidigerum.ctg26400.p1  ORF type:complete len:328 (+),score=91.13 Plantae.Rhodophyta-Purpureofilum_apyrenoidigerum.ctg26400:82-984(+)
MASDGSRRDSEAYEYYTQAEQKLKEKSGWFKSMMGLADDNKFEEAAQMFVKAGNTYKLGKNWKKAGETFVRAAECFEKSSNGMYDAASKYADAAKAFKNGHTQEALRAMSSAISIYENLGRFQQCAKLNKEMAEIYESNEDTEKAIDRYTKAADFWDGEDAKSNANTCRVKIAELSALAKNYDLAIELFENVASAALESGLLKYGAKEHLLRAGMCRLCLGDDVGAKRAMDKYTGMDPSFADSREFKLLNGITQAVEDGDAEAFTDAAYEFDSIATLDPWKTKILLQIKKGLQSKEEDLT